MKKFCYFCLDLLFILLVIYNPNFNFSENKIEQEFSLYWWFALSCYFCIKFYGASCWSQTLSAGFIVSEALVFFLVFCLKIMSDCTGEVSLNAISALISLSWPFIVFVGLFLSGKLFLTKAFLYKKISQNLFTGIVIFVAALLMFPPLLSFIYGYWFFLFFCLSIYVFLPYLAAKKLIFNNKFPPIALQLSKNVFCLLLLFILINCEIILCAFSFSEPQSFGKFALYLFSIAFLRLGLYFAVLYILFPISIRNLLKKH